MARSWRKPTKLPTALLRLTVKAIPRARAPKTPAIPRNHPMGPMLMTTSVCLQCHGQPEGLLPEVKARLQTLYPRDQATGYQLND